MPTPVEVERYILEFVWRVAGGVERTDDGAHARAGDGIDSYALFLEGADGADVSEPASIAAAQNEADAWLGSRNVRGAGHHRLRFGVRYASDEQSPEECSQIQMTTHVGVPTGYGREFTCGRVVKR